MNPVPEGRTGDQGAEFELVTAGHEDAADLAERLDKIRFSSLRATFGTKRNDFPGAEGGKDLSVDPDNLGTERGG